MQQQNTVSDMYSLLGSVMKPYTELMELAAIWSDGNRFTKGDRIVVISDTPSGKTYLHKDLLSPTHVILKCMGTIDSSMLKIDLENLETNEYITITL